MKQDQEVEVLGILQQVASLRAGQNLIPYAEKLIDLAKPRFSISDSIIAVSIVCAYSYMLIYVVTGVFGVC